MIRISHVKWAIYDEKGMRTIRKRYVGKKEFYTVQPNGKQEFYMDGRTASAWLRKNGYSKEWGSHLKAPEKRERPYPSKFRSQI